MIPSPAYLLVVVGLLAVIGLLSAEWAESRTGIAITKMTASTCFVLMALASGALASTYGRILLAGLLLCWIGDALLLSSGTSKTFEFGIGAFLLGHLAYVAAFFDLGLDSSGLFVGGVFMGTLALAATRWLRPHLPGDFRLAVLGYLVVISFMVATSIGVVAAGGPFIVAIGAIGFAVSDLSVARERFIAPGFINSAWGLPLYFGSQFLLAASTAI